MTSFERFGFFGNHLLETLVAAGCRVEEAPLEWGVTLLLPNGGGADVYVLPGETAKTLKAPAFGLTWTFDTLLLAPELAARMVLMNLLLATASEEAPLEGTITAAPVEALTGPRRALEA